MRGEGGHNNDAQAAGPAGKDAGRGEGARGAVYVRRPDSGSALDSSVGFQNIERAGVYRMDR